MIVRVGAKIPSRVSTFGTTRISEYKYHKCDVETENRRLASRSLQSDDKP